MKRHQLSFLVLLASLAGCTAEPRVRAPGGRVALPAPLFEGMGPHHRSISTRSDDAQRYFDQGIVWMYAFNHDEAIRSFEAAVRFDPTCAMTWWGIAMCHGPHINKPGMDARQNEGAWRALQRALALRSGASPVEQELIDAAAVRYAEHPPEDRRPLDEAYAEAMRALAARYPNDADIVTLKAEALMDLRPWDLWTIEGMPKPGVEEIVETLEHALSLDSDHPGANHLMIHAVEASANPARGNAAADRLRSLVPASGHLVHMPSHIDVRTGRWALAAESNERAIEVDRAYEAVSPRQGFYRVYLAHNLHFLSYVSMMEGRRGRAIETAREMLASIPPSFIAEQPALVDPFMSIEMEALKRFGLWDQILALPEPPARLPITRAHRAFMRGVAFAAKGDVARALREQRRFRSLAARVPDDAMLMINKAHDVLAIADLVLSAEIAYRQDRLDAAIESLRSAASLEDRLIYMEPPEWMLPVRHTLGAFLLEAGNAMEAEREYREDLRRWPDNGWSLQGLAKALRAQRRDSEAKEVERRFEVAWARADVRIDASCLCASGRAAAGD